MAHISDGVQWIGKNGEEKDIEDELGKKVSSLNIKTVGGQSLLGSGDIPVGGSIGGTVDGDLKIEGKLEVSEPVLFDDRLDVKDNIFCDGVVYTSKLDVDTTAYFNGSLTVQEALNCEGAINAKEGVFDGSGRVYSPNNPPPSTPPTPLNNTLTSTSTTAALTAAQGKILNDTKHGVTETLTTVGTWGISLEPALKKIKHYAIISSKTYENFVLGHSGYGQSVFQDTPAVLMIRIYEPNTWIAYAYDGNEGFKQQLLSAGLGDANIFAQSVNSITISGI